MKSSFSLSVFQNELGVFEEQRGGHVTTICGARGKKRTKWGWDPLLSWIPCAPSSRTLALNFFPKPPQAPDLPSWAQDNSPNLHSLLLPQTYLSCFLCILHSCVRDIPESVCWDGKRINSGSEPEVPHLKNGED